MKGNVRVHSFLFFFTVFVMTHHPSLGMGYRHSEMNRSLGTFGAAHIVTRLASRSIAGHIPPYKYINILVSKFTSFWLAMTVYAQLVGVLVIYNASPCSFDGV